MIAPSNGKGRPDDGVETRASQSSEASVAGPSVDKLLKPAADKADPTKAGQPIDDLHGAIQELIGLFDIAGDLARRGEQVNIDLLAMRVAVLCDAISDADPSMGRPYRADLEALLGHLNMLESTLLRERVQLALSVEAADRRLRAKAAYGRVLPSMTAAPEPSRRTDDPSDE
jgi:hypothetical protein